MRTLFCLLLALPCFATISPVQHVVYNCGSANPCTVPVASIGANDLVFVSGALEGEAPKRGSLRFTSIVGGGVYVLNEGCNAMQLYGGIGVDCGFTTKSTAGDTAIKVTMNDPTNPLNLDVREYAYTKSSIALDAVAAFTDGTCVNCSGRTLSVTGTNDVIIQWISSSGFGSINSVSGGYGNFATIPGSLIGAADLLNTTDGTAPTWNLTISQVVFAAAIAFKEQ